MAGFLIVCISAAPLGRCSSLPSGAYLLTYLFTRPTRHPSDLKDRFGLSRRVIDLDMWVGSCIPYVQTGGVGGGLG